MLYTCSFCLYCMTIKQIGSCIHVLYTIHTCLKKIIPSCYYILATIVKSYYPLLLLHLYCTKCICSFVHYSLQYIYTAQQLLSPTKIIKLSLSIGAKNISMLKCMENLMAKLPITKWQNGRGVRNLYSKFIIVQQSF